MRTRHVSLEVNHSILYFNKTNLSKFQNSSEREINEVNYRIKSLIGNIKNLEQVTEIKIKRCRITYLKNHEKCTLKLNSSQRATLRKMLKAKEVLRLKHDKIGEKIAKTIKEQDIPEIFYFASGGGGHKTTAQAIQENALTKVLRQVLESFKKDDYWKDDNRLREYADFFKFCKNMGFIKEFDVLHDFAGDVGKFSSRQWNEAQISGNIKKQEFLGSKIMLMLADLFFGPFVFFSTLKNLIMHRPKKIVSTQALATPSILFAILIYNAFLKNKDAADVKLHLYMTDMPTQYSGHFFNSLKRLSTISGRDHLILHAPKPKNDTDWEVLCNVPKEQVMELTTQELPIRPAFFNALETLEQLGSKMQMKINSSQELTLLREVLSRQNPKKDWSEFGSIHENKAQTVDHKIQHNDENYFLMLGSQPIKQDIKDYLNEFIEVARNHPTKNYNFFAYAGNFDVEIECFYKEFCEFIKGKKDWPSNLTVFPLSYQDSAQIANFELQCHTITSTGGATTMELLVIEELRKKLGLPVKQRYIHTVAVEKRSLIDSIPLWQKGNFLFLRECLGDDKVKVVTPRTFKYDLCKKPLKK